MSSLALLAIEIGGKLAVAIVWGLVKGMSNA